MAKTILLFPDAHLEPYQEEEHTDGHLKSWQVLMAGPARTRCQE